MSRHDFLQYCYVTNHLDQAVEELRSTHHMGPFKELRELHLPTAPDRELVAHFALAFKNGVQFELIQPLDGDTTIYDGYAEGDGFRMRFHHLGRYMESEEEYRDALAGMRTRWPVPVDMAGFGGYFAYADARREQGHFLEIFCFPIDSPAIEAPRY